MYCNDIVIHILLLPENSYFFLNYYATRYLTCVHARNKVTFSVKKNASMGKTDEDIEFFSLAR